MSDNVDSFEDFERRASNKIIEALNLIENQIADVKIKMRERTITLPGAIQTIRNDIGLRQFGDGTIVIRPVSAPELEVVAAQFSLDVHGLRNMA